MAVERSTADVLHDILQNFQEMVRSEVRLARVEIREEVKRAVSSTLWIAVGAGGALIACVFLLWTLAYALAARMPMWAATLSIAVVIGVVSAALIMAGLRMAKRIVPIPERTVESVKENFEWIRQSTK